MLFSELQLLNNSQYELQAVKQELQTTRDQAATQQGEQQLTAATQHGLEAQITRLMEDHAVIVAERDNLAQQVGSS